MNTGRLIATILTVVITVTGVVSSGLPTAPLNKSATSACCVGITGNIDCDGAGGIDIADLSALIDFLYISFTPLCCPAEANVDGDLAGGVDISDLSRLIDFLYISFTPPAPCDIPFTFATHIQPIFTARCASSGCHDSQSPKADLDLSPGMSESQMINVPSSGYPADRVEPGNPNASVLWHKVNGTGVYGSQMPPFGEALTAQELNLITFWIQGL